jgi:hypothetical protein
VRQLRRGLLALLGVARVTGDIERLVRSRPAGEPADEREAVLGCALRRQARLLQCLHARVRGRRKTPHDDPAAEVGEVGHDSHPGTGLARAGCRRGPCDCRLEAMPLVCRCRRTERGRLATGGRQGEKAKAGDASRCRDRTVQRGARNEFSGAGASAKYACAVARRNWSRVALEMPPARACRNADRW